MPVTRLKNGLRIVTDEIPHIESVAIGIWVGTGARHEMSSQNGISHMLEHMMFKGTKTRSALDIAEEIENVGGHLNAYTSREKTAYHARVLKEDVPLALDILSDMLNNSVFDPKELVQEKEVILQEIGQTLDTPDDVIFDYLQITAFPDQSLGRSILGTNQTVSAISQDHLKAYQQKHYVPENLVLAASGNIQHDTLVQMAEAFSLGEEKESLLEAFEKPLYHGGDFRQQQDLEQLHLLLAFQGVEYESPDYYTMAVFSSLFGGGMSSRLFQEIREKRGLAYSIYNFSTSYKDTGIWGIYAGTDSAKGNEALSVMVEELSRLPENLHVAEIARAKAQIKANLLMSLEKPMSRCEQMAGQMLIFDRLIPLSEILEKIDSVEETQIIKLVQNVQESKISFAALGNVQNLKSCDEIL